jgi:hypothetical protein
MSHAAPTPRWYAPWRAAAAEKGVSIDPADVGTAFGLDMSLDTLVPEDTPRSAPAADRPGWVERLALRRKTAG